jgi:hypothetical protein
VRCERQANAQSMRGRARSQGAVFQASASFHHPVHAPEWRDPGIDAAFEGVWRLVMEGLRAPTEESQ